MYVSIFIKGAQNEVKNKVLSKMLTQTQIKGTGSKQTIFPLKHFQVDWCAQNQNEEKNWRAQKLRGSALKKLKPKGELHVKSPFTIMQQFDAFITLKIVTLLNCLVYSNELSFSQLVLIMNENMLTKI